MLRDVSGVTDAELWALVNDHLAAASLTTVRVRSEDTLSVVRLADAKAKARLEHDEPPAVHAGFERRLIAPRYADPQSLSTAVQKLLSPNGEVSVIEPGMLIVSDLTVKLEQVEDLVRRLDDGAMAPSGREVRLEYLTPERLMALATQYASKRGLIGGRKLSGELLPLPDGRSVLVMAPQSRLDEWFELIRSLDRLEPVETERYAPEHFALEEVAGLIEQTIRDAAVSPDPRWKLVIDKLTGSLVITASASDHERIKALLQRLAESPVTTRRPVRSYVIRNRSVTEVVDVLTGLIEAGVLEAGQLDRSEVVRAAAAQRSDRDTGAASPSNTEAPSAPPPDSARSRATGAEASLTLTADEGTNTLIVVGEPRMQEQVEALLKILDVRQPQVMLEVFIIASR